MIRRWMGLTGLVVALVLLSGCWDSIELNRRAVVSGMGIDLQQGEKPKYKVSLQVIIADEISGKYSRGGSPVSVYYGEGRTIFEAVREASRKVPRYLSLGHINALIFSEELARTGIKDVLDYVERDAQIRTTSQVYLAKGQEAADMVKLMTPIGKIPSSDLSQKSQASSMLLGNTYRVEIDDVIRALQVHGGGPVINGVRIEGDLETAPTKANIEQINTPAILQVEGAGLFAGDKLMSWLSLNQSRGLVWVSDKIKQTALVTGCLDQKGYIAYEIIRSRTRVKAQLKDPEHPVIQISVMPQAAIKEVNCGLDVSKNAVLNQLQEELNKVIKQEMQAAVDEAQRIKSDVFGFGSVIERTNPKVWKSLEPRWADVFARLEVEYSVQSVIRYSGMRDRSYQSSQTTKEE
ncbi:Ger(x)C family spore germination protein [Paenibacillus sp. YPG26]|uniref:Ger(x)C family spore germination protein n=1 Tax=Paenibacillus sp. YPG26 TaxID=2878915 RepID=UPI00203C608E|nr:Ger(x)C family spore germination protein [Paenibacillus sp. YPG26]USB32944.1 Ger(x)C family spore germination protein [Paenibacillus sp. YPG26]